jgi:steroid 5-alpha reductase family enzyme
MWYIQADHHHHQEPFNLMDAALVLAFLGFFLMEIVADEQQWNFQSNKYKWLDSNKTLSFSSEEMSDFKRGFLTRGLFSLSRHPNFFAEMSLWFVVYSFGVSSRVSSFELAQLFNYTLLAPVQLLLIFQGSTWLTEMLTLQKYPLYAEYQGRVSRLVPFLIMSRSSKPKNG